MLTAAPFKTVLRGAMLTVLTLFGGMLVGGVLGEMTFHALPGHSIIKPSALHITLSAIPALSGFLIGGALWGVLIGRLGRATDRRRMAVAGMLGFAPITIGLVLVLSALEPVAVEHFGAHVPIHRLFTLLFVPTASMIAGVSAWAIGRGLRNTSLAWALMWRVGVAAALAFLSVNLVMEALGWGVGAPRAAERFTMLTVMLAGNLGAALVGGAVLGSTLDTTVAKPVQPSAD
jgi:MFS family permease